MNDMEENKEKKLVPPMEVVERFDELEAEIKRLRESDNDEDWPKRMKLVEEQMKLQNTYDWSDIVFEDNGKKGLKNVKGEVLVPAEYDDFVLLEPYYYKSLGIGAKKGDYMALVKRDGKGTPMSEFEFHYIERIYGTAIYLMLKKEDMSHFALMTMGKVFTPYEVQDYEMPCDGCVILYSDGKKGLLAIDQGLVYVKPEYDEVIDEGFGEDFTFVKDGVRGRVTLEGRFVSNDEFEALSDDEQDELYDIGFVGSVDDY